MLFVDGQGKLTCIFIISDAISIYFAYISTWIVGQKERNLSANEYIVSLWHIKAVALILEGIKH